MEKSSSSKTTKKSQKNHFLSKITTSYSKSRELSKVVPVYEIGDLLYTTDGKYKKVLKVVDPINIDSLNKEEIKRAISSVQACLNSLLPGQSIQILVSSDQIDIEGYLDVLGEKEGNAPNKVIKNLLLQKKEFLEEYRQKTRNIHNFYIVLESDLKKYEDAQAALEDLTTHFVDEFKRVYMSLEAVGAEQISKVLYEKLSPRSHHVQPFDSNMDLTRWRPHVIKDNGTYLEMDEMYYAFYTISYFPERKGVAWLDSIINTKVNLDLSMTFTVTDKGKQIDHMNGKISELESKKLEGIPRSMERKYDKSIESLERLLDRLEDESENLFDSTFIFSIRENSLEKLQSSCKRLENSIKGSRMKVNKLAHKGANLLWYTLPVGFRNPLLEKQVGWNMYAELIASIMPFNSSEFNYNEGVFVGINKKTNSPIIYNAWDRRYFINSNRFYVGTAGSGKSFGIKVEMFREWYCGLAEMIIVIDPEREYHDIPGANALIFKPGSNFCTNPFHISTTIVDTDADEEDKSDIASYLPIKVGHIKTFVRWIHPKMSELEEATLSRAIRKCYENVGLTVYRNISFRPFGNIEDTPRLPDKFPTLEDLYQLLETMEETSLCSVLEPYVYGEYASMFNGQTNWSLENGVNVLDIHELTEDVQKPMMDILLKTLWEEIKRDRITKKALYCDELGLVADERNPQVMAFIHDMFKRIRKYEGYCCVATQNIADFLSAGRWGTAIINNCNIQTFMGLKGNDVMEIQRSLNIGFSDKELQVLKKDKAQGHCIHIVKGKRIEMQTMATPIEAKALNLKKPEEKMIEDQERQKRKNLTVVK